MDLLKGTLDVLILKTLAGTSMHGYAISRAIRQESEDVLAVEEGALYPALRRLEQRGLLKSQWGNTETGREARFYGLTRAGQRQLQRLRADWQRYAQAMSAVLDR